jgi:hypothetical protein
MLRVLIIMVTSFHPSNSPFTADLTIISYIGLFSRPIVGKGDARHSYALFRTMKALR